MSISATRVAAGKAKAAGVLAVRDVGVLAMRESVLAVHPNVLWESAEKAFDRTLPLTLVLTFILVPSQATRIFKAFLCEPFPTDDNGGTRRFLHDDLSVDCD